MNPIREAPVNFATVYNCPNCNESAAKGRPLAREGWKQCPRCKADYDSKTGGSIGGKPLSKKPDNASPIGPKAPATPKAKPSKEGFCAGCHYRGPAASIPVDGISSGKRREYGLKPGDFICDNCAVEIEPEAFGV